MKISVVIITFNEQDRLAGALESCRAIADEMVVVDSYSTDETLAIAKKFNARIFQHRFQDYGSQKNFALGKARHPWILNLDADEQVSDQLNMEILKLKQGEEPEVGGFLIKRRSRYLGRWIRHSGWYPDRKLRLFKKESARWEGRIHERLVLDGRLRPLAGDILHYTYRNIADHVARLNRYSTFQSEEIRRQRKSCLLLRALLLPPITFLRHYVWRLGFLDGYPGLVIALISSWGTAMKYLKAIELKKENRPII